MIENSVLDNIQNQFEALFPAEKKVATYILNNLYEVVNLNVSELAQKSDTSDATVVRTIKHLGYEGYYQMRLLLSKDLGKNEQLIVESEDTLSAIQKFFSIEAERINRLAQTIDFSQLLEIANVIISCSTAHIVAVGNTVTISTDLGFRLERAGIRCYYSTIYEQFINHISLGTANDCVVAFSRSGASRQVIRAVEIAKKKGMKIIAITGELNQAFISNADYVIKINEIKSLVSSIYKPDSHLQEIAINDALLYVIQSLKNISEHPDNNLDDKDSLGILLSEFKQ